MCECSARNSESKPRSSSALPSASGRIPSSVTNVAIPNFMSPSNHGRGATGHSAGERELARRNVGCVKLSGMPDTTLTRAQVAAFPSGKHHSLIKGAEARLAIDQGAREIDMVIDIGAAVAGDYNAVLADILTVREAIGLEPVLKVIIESAVLSDEAIVETCRAAERAGANFVKTSTGFHPAGGASVAAVRLMADTVGGRLGVKASGGIRTAEAALDLIAAGATRLGLSGTRAVLADLPE